MLACVHHSVTTIKHNTVVTAPSHVIQWRAGLTGLHLLGHTLHIICSKGPRMCVINLHVAEHLIKPTHNISIKPAALYQLGCPAWNGAPSAPPRSMRRNRSRNCGGFFFLPLCPCTSTSLRLAQGINQNSRNSHYGATTQKSSPCLNWLQNMPCKLQKIGTCLCRKKNYSPLEQKENMCVEDGMGYVASLCTPALQAARLYGLCSLFGSTPPYGPKTAGVM